MDDAIETLIAELVGATEAHRIRAALNEFAAQIVHAVLPDDPIAQQACIRKAEALGIEIAANSGSNVVRLTDYIRANVAPPQPSLDQRTALLEINETLAGLAGVARAAHLEMLAQKIEALLRETANHF